MSNEGPTTVGSIVAKLKMDRDQWVADKDLTKADARELGALNPTIRIDVDTSRAMAQIEALRVAAEGAGVVAPGQPVGPSGPAAGTAAKVDSVAVAEARLAAAESLSESATQRAILAEMRLNEVRTKGKQTAVQLAAAEFAASEAVKKSEQAAVKAIAAEDALAAAQAKVARAALEEAAAKDVNTASTNKAASANRNNLGFMGLIIGAAAILIPMLVPLAANVVAVTGALSGMGVAGVLGILGVKNAMAAGTAQGAQFSSGLQTLKGDLSQLEGTAATGMLAMFNTAVGDINAALPSLNGEISNFTGLLSGVASSILPGILNGFRVLNPLFMDAGQHIQAIADGFLRWTQDGGLQQFAAYAISTIPQVEASLQALGSALVHILQALMPLGTVGLVVLQDVSNVINALPVPVLTALTVGALAGFAAFKLWGAIAPILQSAAGAVALFAGAETAAGVAATGFGIAVDTAMGPIGLVVAIVGALAGAIAISAAAADQATASMATYTDALAQDNGILGDNVRAQAAKALADNGAIDSAKKLGLSAATVTDATMGNVAAMKTVTAATKAASDGYKATQEAAGKYGAVVFSATDKQIAAKKAADDLNAKIKAQKDAIDATVKSGIDYNSAMQLGGSVAQTMATDLGMTVDAYGKLTAAQTTATAAAKTWKTEIDILNGASQSLEQININLATDAQTMATTIAANVKAVGKAAADSMDINTAAGLQNHTNILKTIQDMQAKAQAEIAGSDGSIAAQNKANDALRSGEKAFVDQMVAAGFNRDAIQQVVDTIGKIPAHIYSQFEIDTASAMAKIAALKAAIAAAAPGAQTSVGVNTAVPSGPLAKWAAPAAPGHAGGGTTEGPGTSTSDSVLTWLSVGEETIKASSAGFNRPFLKAYNANPAKALASVAGSGSGGNVSVQVVNKSGAAIGDLIEMYIENAAGRRKVNLSTGMQKVAY